MLDKNMIIDLIKAKKNKKCIARNYYYYKPKKDEDLEVNTYAKGLIRTIRKDKAIEIYTNYFKVLVNQKIDFLLAKEVTTKTLPEEFDIQDILEKMSLEASLDSTNWLHFYINSESRLDWILINDKEIIPIYDKYNKYIVKIIRFYDVDDKTINVEVWDKDSVILIEIKKDKVGKVETKTHYEEKVEYQGVIEEAENKSFGFVPFIPLFNNKGKTSDIEDIQVLLDMYNSISSGFIDNINTFQEAIMKLKGYNGTDLDKFNEQLRKHKVIPIDKDGDFEYLKVEIPVQARQVLLDILKKNIFLIGRGVDQDLIGDGNLTNVVIKSRYANLDMKANDTEKCMKLFYKQLIKCINKFYNSNINDEIVFKRTMIFNETELINNCVKLEGIISKETLFEMIPYINNAKEELKRVDKEALENQERFDKNIENTKKNNNEEEANEEK